MILRRSIFLFLPFVTLFFSEISFSESKIATEIFGSPPLISKVAISPSGDKLALLANLEDGGSTIFVRNLKNNKLTPIVNSDNKFMKLRSFDWFDEDIILAKVWFSEKKYRTMLDNFGLLRILARDPENPPLLKRDFEIEGGFSSRHSADRIILVF